MIPEIPRHPGPVMLLSASARRWSAMGGGTKKGKPKAWVLKSGSAPLMPADAVLDAWAGLAATLARTDHVSRQSFILREMTLPAELCLSPKSEPLAVAWPWARHPRSPVFLPPPFSSQETVRHLLFPDVDAAHRFRT